MRGKLRLAAVVCFLLVCCLAHAQSLSVYPNPIQFGTVALNSPSSPVYVYLSDTGTSSIDVTSITISGANSHDFTLSAPSCVGTIPGGSYCLTLMTFTPSAMGARSASLVVAINGVTTPVTVALTGTGGNPIPTITSLSPANVYVDSAATTITINGTGFLTSSLAYFGNTVPPVPLPTTYVSATQLKAVVPASDLTQAIQTQIYVSNPPPAGGSFSANLQIVDLEPLISSVSPSSVVAGTNPGPIVINGNSFMTGATVQWNGASVPATYVNSG